MFVNFYKVFTFSVKFYKNWNFCDDLESFSRFLEKFFDFIEKLYRII